MPKRIFASCLCISLICALLPLAGHTGWGDFFKGLTDAVKSKPALSEGDIVAGLRDALKVGAGNAVQGVSKLNGYYQNPSIKILLPENVQKAEKTLRMVGLGQQVDAFELSMNRAAEKAAPEAKALFWDTIKQMRFADAKKILNGRENEATLYFKDRTHTKLQDRFKPLVHQAMADVGVTRNYQRLNDKMRTLPFVDRYSFDLDGYVTNKALEGLFFMLAQEEAKIRKDPAARVTDILKKVFAASK